MAMIAIPLSLDISRLFREVEIDSLGARDASDHITMFYLGDEIPIKKLVKIIPIVFDITSKTKPFSASCSKIISFPEGKKGFPIIGEVKSSELLKFREQIKKEFKKNKIKFDEKFPEYKPHVTLGYSKTKPSSIKFSKTNWSITQVGLYGGDEADSKFFVNFPFTLGIEKKVEKYAKLFCNKAYQYYNG
jgi:2'-5' RNA ligase